MPELWRRPWAMVDLHRRHRAMLESDTAIVPAAHRAALWLYLPAGEEALVNGRAGTGERVPGFGNGGSGRDLLLFPLPLASTPKVSIRSAGHTVQLEWPELPDRPPSAKEPQTELEHRSYRLMLRALNVWDRLHDVDTALADPARLWPNLTQLWTQPSSVVEPRMDIIVRHAFALTRVLDQLERAPRRILRRTHEQVPLSRVQELDRRAMTWLVRQPGDTLAERAGDRQRLLAVAREENYDTLENRVLRAYGELAALVARDYVARNRSKAESRRARRVADFGKRCRRLSHDLASRGVRLAEAGISPNFVLQQNATYREIWGGWQDLLRMEQEKDDIWRWQVRSFEEFCALAVVVGLERIPDARLIAAAPLVFRDEQYRGSWVAHDNPFVVIHLPAKGFVVEIRYRMRQPSAALADFGAPIWVRVGRINEVDRVLANVPVWPVWDATGGLVENEAEELDRVVAVGARAQVVSGLVLRPVPADGQAERERSGRATVATIGVEGEALRQGLEALTDYFVALFEGDRL